jgi:hypothetical protein
MLGLLLIVLVVRLTFADAFNHFGESHRIGAAISLVAHDRKL